jgi:hypothetical protein
MQPAATLAPQCSLQVMHLAMQASDHVAYHSLPWILSLLRLNNVLSDEQAAMLCLLAWAALLACSSRLPTASGCKSTEAFALVLKARRCVR